MVQKLVSVKFCLWYGLLSRIVTPKFFFFLLFYELTTSPTYMVLNTCFMLSLQAFSQDKSIYEAVENAFISIYIRKNPVETAKQLLNLAIDSNIGDQAALEFIVNALVSKGEISSSTVSSLFDSSNTCSHTRSRTPKN